ncbi:MAG: GMC family oxidoreductase N-terminal domain-containing protein [Pseudonocardia sp.]
MVLSTPMHDIASTYDVVVVGSGYGGGIAASRLARAGRRVCVLERGAEFAPGEFPRTPAEASAQIQIDAAVGRVGDSTGLFDFRRNDDMNVLVGCGLGGTSLINAGVVLPAEDRVFDDERWPALLRERGALDEGYRRARNMLRPVPFPDQWLPKLDAMRAAADRIGADFTRPPIAVNHSGGVNHVGVVQQACRSCGDCVSGCNFAAKNSVDLTYLPDARNHGAEIFTRVRVRRVERSGDGWLVHYRPVGYGRGAFDAPEMFVRAEVVVLAAGALGSPEILLRSAAHGLPVSRKLGQGFTSNGDVLAFAYNCDVPIHGIGFGAAETDPGTPVGPCIAGLIDLREQADLEDGMVIEEGAIPGAMLPVLAEALAVAAVLGGVDTDYGVADRLGELIRELKSIAADGGALQHTLTYLVMAHDNAGGRMHLDDDRLRIEWPGVGRLGIFRAIRDRLIAATAALGGTYVPNPMASELLGQDLVTVHPLGGAAMGEDAGCGVVDHKGRVFAGTEGTDVHEGLYVCDGAVVPRSLGVNPLLTISAVAERCCELLVADRGWSLDYALPSAPVTPAPTPRPGLSFTERMRGPVTLGGIRSAFGFTLTAVVEDLDRFLDDDQRRARLAGTVEAPALSAAPLTARGVLELLVVDPADPGIRRMTYRMLLSSTDGATFGFHGEKTVHDDRGIDGWADTTTLHITLRDGTESGPVLGTGVLRIRPADFTTQLTTIRAIGASTPRQQLAVLNQFGSYFTRSLAEVYISS